MVFVVIGVLLVALKFFDVGPTAAWSWWMAVAPFAVAVAWWAYSDATGRTAQRAADKNDERVRHRREKNAEAMGLTKNKRR